MSLGMCYLEYKYSKPILSPVSHTGQQVQYEEYHQLYLSGSLHKSNHTETTNRTSDNHYSDHLPSLAPRSRKRLKSHNSCLQDYPPLLAPANLKRKNRWEKSCLEFLVVSELLEKYRCNLLLKLPMTVHSNSATVEQRFGFVNRPSITPCNKPEYIPKTVCHLRSSLQGNEQS